MSTPVSSISATSTIWRRGRGRLSVTLSMTPTHVTSAPTSAWETFVMRVKSR